MTDRPPTTPIPGTVSPSIFPEQLNFAAEPAIPFDADEFLHFLDDEDWTVEQKREYVRAMWSLVTALLDWNFKLHPIQEAIEAAKQLERATPK